MNTQQAQARLQQLAAEASALFDKLAAFRISLRSLRAGGGVAARVAVRGGVERSR